LMLQEKLYIHLYHESWVMNYEIRNPTFLRMDYETMHLIVYIIIQFFYRKVMH